MKFGLIGIGSIGSVPASALRRTKGCELVAVHDLDAARARAIAPQAKFHATVASLFSSTECEAVIISTPPQFHEQLVVEALRNGKHVLVETPMAPTIAACRRLICRSLTRSCWEDSYGWLQPPLLRGPEAGPGCCAVRRDRPVKPCTRLCRSHGALGFQSALDVRRQNYGRRNADGQRHPSHRSHALYYGRFR